MLRKIPPPPNIAGRSVSRDPSGLTDVDLELDRSLLVYLVLCIFRLKHITSC